MAGALSKRLIERSRRATRRTGRLLRPIVRSGRRVENSVYVRQPLVLISQVQRSGGTLLSQSLDDHPECFAHPNELTWGRPTKYRWPDVDLGPSRVSVPSISAYGHGDKVDSGHAACRRIPLSTVTSGTGQFGAIETFWPACFPSRRDLRSRCSSKGGDITERPSRLLKNSVKWDRQIDPGVLPCSQHR